MIKLINQYKPSTRQTINVAVFIGAIKPSHDPYKKPNFEERLNWAAMEKIILAPTNNIKDTDLGLKAKWEKFKVDAPCSEVPLTDEEIIAEVKSVRRENHTPKL